MSLNAVFRIPVTDRGSKETETLFPVELNWITGCH